jgi:4-carboxymuconolactone decarboxylase
MTETQTPRERGLEILNDVYRRDLGITGDKNPYQEVTVDHLFGDIWAREGLTFRERRLLTLGVLAAIGRDELVELQLFSALQRGEVTPDQVNEIIVHLTHYVGWPHGSAINNAAQRAIADHLAAAAGSGD